MLFPEKPSKRITQALTDLKNFSARKNCEVDMDIYHLVRDGKLCVACLGGASAIQRLKPTNIHRIYSREKLVDALAGDVCYADIENFECSIDAFRVGAVGFGFRCMGLTYRQGVPFNRFITSYHDNKRAFFRDMRRLAKDLDAAGF